MNKSQQPAMSRTQPTLEAIYNIQLPKFDDKKHNITVKPLYKTNDAVEIVLQHQLIPGIYTVTMTYIKIVNTNMVYGDNGTEYKITAKAPFYGLVIENLQENMLSGELYIGVAISKDEEPFVLFDLITRVTATPNPAPQDTSVESQENYMWPHADEVDLEYIFPTYYHARKTTFYRMSWKNACGKRSTQKVGSVLLVFLLQLTCIAASVYGCMLLFKARNRRYCIRE